MQAQARPRLQLRSDFAQHSRRIRSRCAAGCRRCRQSRADPGAPRRQELLQRLHARCAGSGHGLCSRNVIVAPLAFKAGS